LTKYAFLQQLVQSLKDLRANAISILREISSQLVKKSEQEGTTERRKSFVDACATIVKSDVSSNAIGISLFVVPDT
jgi:N-terminal acetyltransferase B complex non-catalytic subunit